MDQATFLSNFATESLVFAQTVTVSWGSKNPASDASYVYITSPRPVGMYFDLLVSTSIAYTVTLPVPSGQDGTSYGVALTKSIKTAVSSGAFTNTLQTIAKATPGSTLTTANATTVTVT